MTVYKKPDPTPNDGYQTLPYETLDRKEIERDVTKLLKRSNSSSVALYVLSYSDSDESLNFDEHNLYIIDIIKKYGDDNINQFMDEDDIKINLKIPITQKADKWIVVTTIAPPTEDIKYLAQIPGWRVVIVGDTKTPSNWTFPNCDFLGIEQQKRLGFQITPYLPVKSYSRKSVGYLYAIANGAKVIYDTDDDNRPLDKLKRFTYTEETTGLMYTGERNTFNPYRHFGQGSMWPRGYPLSKIGESFSHSYTLGKWRTPLIQQGLVNGDPDVDAIFRLTRKTKTEPLNVTFSVRAPPVLMRSYSYSPFNAQNTLYLYDAFWGLILPATVTFRVTDIWRSYWSQRLLWEIGGNIAFYPPNAFSKRNPHSYFKDYLQEKDLYFKTENLLKFLSEWTCENKYSFFECVLDLSIKMIQKDYLKRSDGKLITLWIEDLKSISYTEPKRIHMKNMTWNAGRKIKGQTAKKWNTSVIFIPEEEAFNVISLSQNSTYIPEKSINRILHICPNFGFSKENISYLSNVKKYDNILLIILFSSPHYANVKILEALYRPYFPNIVYCGKNKTVFENKTKDLLEPVSFIEIETNVGYFAQRCMLQAMQMNYGVDGYFYVMDDSLLYSKRLIRYKLDKMQLFEVHVLKGGKNFTTGWGWYGSQFGLSAFKNGLKELRNTSIKAYTRFKETLRMNTGYDTGIFFGSSDAMYLPAKYSEEFIFYMDIFSRHQFFLEMAFPTIPLGLTKKENIVFFNATYLWGGERALYLKRLAEKKDFVHPVKMSGMNRTFLCEKIVKPNLFE